MMPIDNADEHRCANIESLEVWDTSRIKTAF